jgi:hypothetical protein
VDYAKHYEKLMERARNRVLEGYVEVHHVLPRCLGGTDDLGNRVPLTPEEHYLAHQLLCKMYPHVTGLVYALIAMSGNPWGKRNNKLYGWIRRRAAIATSTVSLARWQTKEYQNKHKAAMAVVLADPEHGKKLSKAIKGRVYSPEQRAKIIVKRMDTIRKEAKGRAPESAEGRLKKSVAMRAVWEQRRANGEQFDIAAKTKAKRVENGSYQFTAEHRANIAKAQAGRIPWNKGKAGSMTGIPKSEQARANMKALALQRRKPVPPPITPEEHAQRKAERSKNCADWQRGRTLPEQHKAKIAAGLTRAYANGRRGARSKLTDDQVREIRVLLASPGAVQKEIAARYGISQAALSELKAGKSYRHVS